MSDISIGMEERQMISMHPGEFRLQFVQPVEQGARLMDAAAQHDVIEEGRIAGLRVGETLCFEMRQESLAGGYFQVD